MKIWKMNGAGNDFLIVNNIEEKRPIDCYSSFAKKLCHRHMSIGADGFMVVEKADSDADFKMIFLNSDGSLGEMCGNGARCICRYGYEIGLSSELQKIETTAGIVTGERIDETRYRIRLNDPSTIELDFPLDIDGKVYQTSYVELGNPGIPHLVVPISGLRDYPNSELFELGRKMRYHKKLTKGANVNFYEIEEEQIFERTYERGVEDFTYACGTGTGSMVSVLTLKGMVDGQNIAVEVAGGRLYIDINRDGDIIKDLYLTGPTNIVLKGEVFDEELSEELKNLL